MKKIKISLLASAILLFNACGGGGGSTPTGVTGTSYYIDSAVSGVNYTCGSQKGITGTDGSFIFEEGSNCTFYLGEMLLRTVDSDILIDGESIYETDLYIARILQSLDSDSNPDNGITIDANIVLALADSVFPTTSEELDSLLDLLALEGATIVSEIDAENHLKQTKLKTLLPGKVFYAVSAHGGNSFGAEKLSFISASEVIFRELLVSDSNVVVNIVNTLPYIINASGEVVIDFGMGDKNTYELISITDTQWNMIKNDDEGNPYGTWLLNAPDNFPEF